MVHEINFLGIMSSSWRQYFRKDFFGTNIKNLILREAKKNVQEEKKVNVTLLDLTSISGWKKVLVLEEVKNS